MVAIRVENLGKKYRLDPSGRRSEYSYRSLRESMASVAKLPLRLLGKGDKPKSIDFWALAGLDLEVQEGEVLGIIGRNGSGKSTFLKLLSRITRPTSGRAELRGRVGSLLEVGTGFHPELTGRENIFLNGAILGMYRREIAQKFDEIVAFAGVEQFLDTPVKRYSSGMYIRLAFAVAAHLEPEILLVDEVLAVGDHAFQKKCVGKMSEIAASGRTVLLVSHNLPMVANLTTRAIWLNGGHLQQVGHPADVIRSYCEHGAEGMGTESEVSLADHPSRRPGQPAYLRQVRLSNASGRPVTNVLLGGDLNIDVGLAGLPGHTDTCVILDVCDVFGTPLARASSRMQSVLDLGAAREATVRCTLRDIRLLPGDYVVHVGLHDVEEYIDRVENAIRFSVEPADLYGTGRIPHRREGLFAPSAAWEVLPAKAETTCPAELNRNGKPCPP